LDGSSQAAGVAAVQSQDCVEPFKGLAIGQLGGAVHKPFGVVDLSLAPTPTWGAMGRHLPKPRTEEQRVTGATAVLAILMDAVKKGGAFASSYVE
jgi:uncharacterized protein (UPF0210 family)